MAVFDVVVVGAGLFGSAAAKHLSLLRPDLRLGLIGPGEPEDRADTDVSGGLGAGDIGVSFGI